MPHVVFRQEIVPIQLQEWILQMNLLWTTLQRRKMVNSMASKEKKENPAPRQAIGEVL